VTGGREQSKDSGACASLAGNLAIAGRNLEIEAHYLQSRPAEHIHTPNVLAFRPQLTDDAQDKPANITQVMQCDTVTSRLVPS
jgi:hypothetical protein